MTAVRRFLLASFAGLVLAVVPPSVEAQPSADDPLLTVESVVGGLSVPTTMAFLGPDDFLVLQKENGQVRRVVGGTLLPDPVLDVAVQGGSERGLLGIAVNGESPPRAFLYYTAVEDPEGDGVPDNGPLLGNRVYRYDWNPASGRLENPALILDLPVLPGPNHNGGALVLGPAPPPGHGLPGDGRVLYAVIGDLTRNGQLENFPDGAAPDDTAVILAVLQDGSPAPGNPFVPYCSATVGQVCPDGTGCPAGESCVGVVARYTAYGVRNSFGLAIDPLTGALWDTENGTNFYDEVNRVAPGFNSGWQQIMGPDERDPESVDDLFHMPGGASHYSDPEFSWKDPVAVTALVFPAGSALGPTYDDALLVADFNHGQVYRFPLTAARDALDASALPAALQDLVADTSHERDAPRIAHGFGGITDLELGPDGKVYVVDIIRGTVDRLTAADDPGPTPTPRPTPVCGATPAACRTPIVGAKAALVLKDKEDDRRDQLVWKWIKGAATTTADFADPIGGDGYELCIWDGAGLVLAATAPAGDLCDGRPCWVERRTGFRYKDRALTPDGLKTMVLRAGADGRARIVVHGKGAALAMPDLAALTSPLTVQLLKTGGPCWGASYAFPPAARHDATTFRDKAD